MRVMWRLMAGTMMWTWAWGYGESCGWSWCCLDIGILWERSGKELGSVWRCRWVSWRVRNGWGRDLGSGCGCTCHSYEFVREYIHQPILGWYIPITCSQTHFVIPSSRLRRRQNGSHPITDQRSWPNRQSQPFPLQALWRSTQLSSHLPLRKTSRYIRRLLSGKNSFREDSYRQGKDCRNHCNNFRVYIAEHVWK